MALFGEGRGFKLLVGFAAMVILLTVPLLFMELRPPGLWLARDGDLELAPIVCRLDHEQDRLSVITRLAYAPPEDPPLRARVLATTRTGTELATFEVERVTRDPERPTVIRITGPIGDHPPATWRAVRIDCRLWLGERPVLDFDGVYLPPNRELIDVHVRRPGPTTEAPE